MIPANRVVGCLNLESIGVESTSSHLSKAPGNRVLRLLAGFVDGHYVDRQACDLAIERMHRRDSIGDRVHLVFACLGLVCLFGPVTLTEIAFGPLAAFFVIRMFNTLPVWIHGFGQPAVLVAIAIAGWMMITLSWSADRVMGWEEISQLRWFVLVGLIFPVIEKRMVLIAAMGVGIALAQLGQIADAFDGFGIDWLAGLVANQPNRISGWWHPVVGGSILVAAVGFHLPTAIFADGRVRLIGIAGALISGVGLIATNSRGAWIAGVLMMAIVGVFGLKTKRIGLKRGVVVIGVGVLVVASAGVVMRDRMIDRINETRAELREIGEGKLDSMTGVRVMMGQRAIDAGLGHPIGGVGAGGFATWANIESEENRAHAHAHNSVLQIWSTIGLVGIVLWAGLIGIMVRGAWRIWDVEKEGVYGLAPMFAIIGLVLASITDSVHLSTQTAAMLGALAALSPAYRPGHPRWQTDEPRS